MTEEFVAQVSGIGALAEPNRRALYLFVVAQPDAVSREQVAEATGLAQHSVKFHLDRLAREGLLDVEFRRLSDRTGPGAGRPSKLYRRSSQEVAVSLPERRYDVVGEVLAEALEETMRTDVTATQAVEIAATAEGHRIAANATVDPAEQSELQRVAAALSSQGYQPAVSETEMTLTNCPFHKLARDHTELVCRLNLALVQGVLEGLDCLGLEGVLRPRPGHCCVQARQRP